MGIFFSCSECVLDAGFLVIPNLASLSFILFSAFSLILLALSSEADKPDEDDGGVECPMFEALADCCSATAFRLDSTGSFEAKLEFGCAR